MPDVVKNALNFVAKFFDRNNKAPPLVRLAIDLNTGKVAETALCWHSVEFPRLNDSFIGCENRYGYTAAAIQLPVRVPYGFHGNWVAEGALS